jgi:hypothetical protein
VFRPNTLIQYHGGGYDGCVFEYNFAFIDADGEFHDIWHSGCMGIDSLEELQGKYEERPDWLEFTDVTSEEELNRYADRECTHSVMLLARWFEAEVPAVVFRPKCHDCGRRFNAVEARGVNEHGVGGIEIRYADLICPDCDSANSCSACGEYYGPGYVFVNTRNYTHACAYCAERDGGESNGD